MKNTIICTDYDSMGNHGRFPIPKPRKQNKIKSILLYLKKKLNN